MAKCQTLLLLLLLLAAVFIASVERVSAAGEPLEQSKNQVNWNGRPYLNCASACDYRCSKASLHKRCLKYCNICCGKCQCVPPGTAGNREVCRCYDQMKNSRGGHKCP